MTPVDAPTVSRIGGIPYSGPAWRHVSPNRNPLSAEGARIHGGRFNPPESFPVLYLCLSRECAVAEFIRMAERNAIGPGGFLPWRLYIFELELNRVLNLTVPAVIEDLGISLGELVDDDRSVARELGVIAHGLSFQGILSASATGVDRVLAIFPENLGAGTIRPELAEEWTSLKQLDPG